MMIGLGLASSIVRRVRTLGAEMLTAGSWTMAVAGGTSTATESPAGTLNLTGDGTNRARGEQAFSAHATGDRIRLAFTVATASCQFRAGSISQGTDVYADRTFAVGSHVIEFTATADPVYATFYRTSAGLSVVSAISAKTLK